MTAATVTVPLETPAEFGGVTYTSFTFRKMKAKDMVAADLVTGETRKALAMWASMAGVPIGAMEEVDTDDFETISEKVVPLMGKSAIAAMAKAAAKREAKRQS